MSIKDLKTLAHSCHCYHHHHLKRCLCVQADQIGHSCRSTCFKVLYSCTKSTVVKMRFLTYKTTIRSIFVPEKVSLNCPPRTASAEFPYFSKIWKCTYKWCLTCVCVCLIRTLVTRIVSEERKGVK